MGRKFEQKKQKADYFPNLLRARAACKLILKNRKKAIRDNERSVVFLEKSKEGFGKNKEGKRGKSS